MAKFSLTLEMEIDLNGGVTPAQLNKVMYERLKEHMTATFLTGFTGAMLKRYTMKVKHQLPVPKILTLSQLALMPAGTVVSPVGVILTKDGEQFADFDIQGVLKTKGEHVIHARDSWQIVMRPLKPDITVREGRVFTHTGEHAYLYPNNRNPHRFVLWEE